MADIGYSSTSPTAPCARLLGPRGGMTREKTALSRRDLINRAAKRAREGKENE